GSSRRARRREPPFQPGLVLPGLFLLGRVAAQVAVGRPVRADADLRAEALHGAARGLDAFGLEQVVGQLLVRPVGPVEPAAGPPADDPGLDLVGRAVWDGGGPA